MPACFLARLNACDTTSCVTGNTRPSILRGISVRIWTAYVDSGTAQVAADSFSDFAHAVANDTSPRKGLAYICSALSEGTHYEKPTEHLGIAHWRLKNYGLPRRFLAFDFDGFESPEVFHQGVERIEHH